MWLFEKDKVLHLIAGFVIALLSYAFFMCIIPTFPWWCLLIGALTSALASVGKELVYDKWMGKGVFNWKDLWAGLIGDGAFALAAALLILII